MPQRAKIRVLGDQESFRDALGRMVHVLSHETHVDGEQPYLLRIEARVPHTNVFDVLETSSSPQKFYWSNRNRTFEWMGLGIGIKLEAKGNQTHDLMKSMEGVFDAIGGDVQFYGGTRFDADVVDSSLWREFLVSCFVLPALEIKNSETGSSVSLNVVISGDLSLKKANELLLQLIENKTDRFSETELPRIKKESRAISASEWKSKITASTELVASGKLQKIVLANAHDFWLEETIDPVWVLRRLNEKSPSTYRFLMQYSVGHAFVGASPEQLYARNGQRIESEAQAGTRPRGKDLAEDAALAEELLSSRKEFVEHDVVFQHIENALGALCKDHGWIDQRKVNKLSHVQHLRSRFGGILRDRVTDAQILEALHPTPAVGGWPKSEALARISEFENFDRGYYCGPIGLIGKNRTEFAVALRSALVSADRVRIFAGAGIVEGSTAENEWNEIDSKMRLYYDIFRK